MTYLQFHVAFMVPPLALVALPAWRARRRLGTRGPWALFVMPLIALLYTTPWDNYLVAHGIWTYGPDRVVGTIGWVPVEEYVFFLLQPLLTGAVLYGMLDRTLRARGPLGSSRRPHAVRVVGALAGLLLTMGGALLLTSEAGRYMGLILVWSMPLLAAMWLGMGPAIWRVRGPALVAVAVPTVYLWVADRVAIGVGIWAISPQYTLGVNPFGLPIEEATFFLVTNLLVVIGVLLFLLPGLPAPADA